MIYFNSEDTVISVQTYLLLLSNSSYWLYFFYMQGRVVCPNENRPLIVIIKYYTYMQGTFLNYANYTVAVDICILSHGSGDTLRQNLKNIWTTFCII